MQTVDAEALDAAVSARLVAQSSAPTAAPAGVRTLVLTSLFPPSGVPDEVWIAAAGEEFGGDVVVARDLLVV